MKRFSLPLLIIFLYNALIAYGEPVNKKQIETKIKTLQKTLQRKKASYLKIRQRYSQITVKIKRVKSTIGDLKEKIKNNRKQLELLEKEISKLNTEVKLIGGDLTKQKQQLYKELNEYYRYSSVGSYYKRGVWYDQMNRYITSCMQDKIKRYVAHREYLKKKMDRLKSLMKQQKNILKRIENQKARMNEQIQKLARLKEESLKEKRAYLAQIKLLNSERDRLQQLLQSIIAKEREAAKRQREARRRKKLQKRSTVRYSPMPHNLIPPVKGKVVDTFGKKYDTLFRVYTRNNGIDIRTRKGSYVHVVYAGKVDYVGSLLGYGTVIIVNHLNGYYTVYGGVKPSVRRGEYVKTSQCIGMVEGDRLHFEIRKHAQAIDPLKFLNRRYLR